MGMEAMQKLMGGSAADVSSTPAKLISIDQIVEINAFMLEEMNRFVQSFDAISDKSPYDAKLVMIASQATLDAKITAKFGVESESMQASMEANKHALVQNQSFVSSHMQMQQAAESLLSTF